MIEKKFSDNDVPRGFNPALYFKEDDQNQNS